MISQVQNAMLPTAVAPNELAPIVKSDKSNGIKNDKPLPKELSPIKILMNGLVSNLGKAILVSFVWQRFDRYMLINPSNQFVKDYLAPLAIFASIKTLVGSVDQIAFIIIGTRPAENNSDNASNFFRKRVWKVIIFVEDTAAKVDGVFSDKLNIRSYRQINLQKVPLNKLSVLELLRKEIISFVGDTAVEALTAYIGIKIINKLGLLFLKQFSRDEVSFGGLVEEAFSLKGIVPIACLNIAGGSFLFIKTMLAKSFTRNALLSPLLFGLLGKISQSVQESQMLDQQAEAAKNARSEFINDKLVEVNEENGTSDIVAIDIA